MSLSLFAKSSYLSFAKIASGNSASRSLAAFLSSRRAPLLHQQHAGRTARSFASSAPCATTSIGDRPPVKPNLSTSHSAFELPTQTHGIQDLTADHVGHEVVLYGYLGSRVDLSKKISFVPLVSADLSSSIQLISVADAQSSSRFSCHATLKAQSAHSPVAARGIVKSKQKSRKDQSARVVPLRDDLEVELVHLDVFNGFPSDVNFEADTVFPPEQRHLHLRQNKELRDALQFRARAARHCQRYLGEEHGFLEVETPLLFKPTPEGAREFIVPTRRKDHVYALPQSPQQYKQILMASGIPKYFQLAKCFRDEDLRADRQPEFTQLDVEMAFASDGDVMNCIENLIRSMWAQLLPTSLPPDAFPRMSYHDAMSRYGSDKPDTRLGSELVRIDYMIPVDLVSKIGPLTEPIVEAFKMSVSQEPSESRAFVTEFMDSADARPFLQNPEGQPGMFIFDSRKPLSGLHPFGFEAAEQLEAELELADGDVVAIQARADAPFSGGSTMLGNLRLALHKAALATGRLPAPTGWNFLWINDFPLFSPATTSDDNDGRNTAQKGNDAALTSTHHPFTAPATAHDLALLLDGAPRAARAAHFDLVLNGAELGGGSRRIHDAALQERVLRDVLGLDGGGLAAFAHLLGALRAGCPPHAGFALGFDRLVAAMLGRASIRDVIAFPKSGRGEDALVGSPGLAGAHVWPRYGLRREEEEEVVVVVEGGAA